MVLPPVVGGIALFFAIGRRGLVGQYLDRWFGITLPFTTAAVVVAQTFVAMPFLVLTVEAALRQLDRRYEDAARTLGASRWYAFRRVTIPAIRPALAAGAVLAWARALGEFGATITFAGNYPGTTQTMPLAIYVARESDQDKAIVLSLLLIAVSFAGACARSKTQLSQEPATATWPSTSSAGCPDRAEAGLARRRPHHRRDRLHAARASDRRDLRLRARPRAGDGGGFRPPRGRGTRPAVARGPLQSGAGAVPLTAVRNTNVEWTS